MLVNNVAMVDLQRAFSDVASVLSCKICLGRLRKPVFLKICQHTFCEECISKVYLSEDKKCCPYCYNQSPENKIISADYERDKLETICAMLLEGIAKDFGEEVSQKIVNSSNLGLFSNFGPRGVATKNYRESQCVESVVKLDNNSVNPTFGVESSSVAEPNTTLENPAQYLDEMKDDEIKVEMKDDEITNFECEPPEKRRCELFNEGNVSNEHIMQDDTCVTTEDIKTEKEWGKWW